MDGRLGQRIDLRIGGVTGSWLMNTLWILRLWIIVLVDNRYAALLLYISIVRMYGTYENYALACVLHAFDEQWLTDTSEWVSHITLMIEFWFFLWNEKVNDGLRARCWKKKIQKTDIKINFNENQSWCAVQFVLVAVDEVTIYETFCNRRRCHIVRMIKRMHYRYETTGSIVVLPVHWHHSQDEKTTTFALNNHETNTEHYCHYYYYY